MIKVKLFPGLKNWVYTPQIKIILNWRNRVRKREVLDATMMVTLVYLCGSGLTGSRIETILHEWCGILFSLCVFLHLAWNKRWFLNLLEGKYSATRWIHLALNLLLNVLLILILISSLMISRHIFAFLDLHGSLTGRRIHLVATAWLMPIAAIHFGVHHHNTKRNLIWYALSAGGIIAFSVLRYYERMFLLSEFAYVPDFPKAIFYLLGLLIFIMFSVFGTEITRAIKKVSKNNDHLSIS